MTRLRDSGQVLPLGGAMKVCLFCRRIHKRRKYCSDKCKAKHYAAANREKLNAVKSAWKSENPDYYKEYWKTYRRKKSIKNAKTVPELESILMKGVKY